VTNLSRREVFIGAAAVVAAASIPAISAIPAAAAPAELIPAWVVGSEGEFNWQHVVARTERQALRFFAQECGDYEEDCDHDSHQDDCDCCDAIASYTAERKPMWDGKREGEITPGDWLRSGTGHVCSRCSYETFPEEGGHGVGNEAVCEECMELADWDIVDPERAAEIRAYLAQRGKAA
jgi:hypothetical protein